MSSFEKAGNEGVNVVADPLITASISARMPDAKVTFGVVGDVQDEMMGLPLNAENAFRFIEEVRNRIAEKIIFEVHNNGPIKR